jgi:hypothetical protein
MARTKKMWFNTVTQVQDGEDVLVGNPVHPEDFTLLTDPRALFGMRSACAVMQFSSPCEIEHPDGTVVLSTGLYVYDHHERAMLLSVIDTPSWAVISFN